MSTNFYKCTQGRCNKPDFPGQRNILVMDWKIPG